MSILTLFPILTYFIKSAEGCMRMVPPDDAYISTTMSPEVFFFKKYKFFRKLSKNSVQTFSVNSNIFQEMPTTMAMESTTGEYSPYYRLSIRAFFQKKCVLTLRILLVASWKTNLYWMEVFFKHFLRHAYVPPYLPIRLSMCLHTVFRYFSQSGVRRTKWMHGSTMPEYVIAIGFLCEQ